MENPLRMTSYERIPCADKSVCPGFSSKARFSIRTRTRPCAKSRPWKGFLYFNINQYFRVCPHVHFRARFRDHGKRALSGNNNIQTKLNNVCKLLHIILFRHSRYTGNRDTINITQKKKLPHEANQLHPKSDINHI